MNDELMLLWQQGASQEPDAAEVARLAGRASVVRFEKRIFWRNMREYLAGAVVLIAGIRGLWRGPYVAGPISMIAGVLFVMVYLWRSHRNDVPLDAAADARAYHAAMLEKLDRQILLLSKVRYWYVLPCYLPMLVFTLSNPNPVGQKVVGLGIATLFCGFVIWLNERFAVGKLKVQREKIEALYKEEQ